MTILCVLLVSVVRESRRDLVEFSTGSQAVILRATGECIGDCGLVPQQVDGVAEIEIGYHLRRDLWGQGLATEAALGCLNHGMTTFGCRRFVSLIHPHNTASRRVAETTGMTLEREVDGRTSPCASMRWNDL